MSDRESRQQRRERHAREVEESQQQLRENIAATQRLLNSSDEMLKRHRGEWEADDE